MPMILVLEVGDGLFEVLSTAGDTHLGGDDFDKAHNLCCYFCWNDLLLHLLGPFFHQY